MVSKNITPDEVAAVLRSAIRGEIKVGDLSALNWWQLHEPDVIFGDWTIRLFIEADWIYNVYDAYAPDGRIQEFDAENDPMKLLTDEEALALARRLGWTKK